MSSVVTTYIARDGVTQNVMPAAVVGVRASIEKAAGSTNANATNKKYCGPEHPSFANNLQPRQASAAGQTSNMLYSGTHNNVRPPAIPPLSVSPASQEDTTIEYAAAIRHHIGLRSWTIVLR